MGVPGGSYRRSVWETNKQIGNTKFQGRTLAWRKLAPRTTRETRESGRRLRRLVSTGRCLVPQPTSGQGYGTTPDTYFVSGRTTSSMLVNCDCGRLGRESSTCGKQDINSNWKVLVVLKLAVGTDLSQVRNPEAVIWRSHQIRSEELEPYRCGTCLVYLFRYRETRGLCRASKWSYTRRLRNFLVHETPRLRE